MAAPVLSALNNTATLVNVVFDQAVTASTGRPGEGFSITVNGVARYADSASIVTTTVANDTVRLVLLGYVGEREVVKVSYSNATNNLQSVSQALPPANFTNRVSTNNSLHASLLSAVVAENCTDSDTLTLTWSLPIASAALATGVTIYQNGLSVPIVSVTQLPETRKLAIKAATGFQNQDVVTWSYDSALGDWTTSGYDIVTFLNQATVNASKLGTPGSQYPLSSIIREQLSPVNGTVNATVSIDLNSVDELIVSRYGPLNVDFGGTFGVTVDNPTGVVIPQDIKPISQGLVVTKAFFVLQSKPQWAATAATEWLGTITARVSAALGTGRTYDQATVLGNRTVSPV